MVDFQVKLTAQEQKEFTVHGLAIVNIGASALVTPVYIKDEGYFFSIWTKADNRIDIPLRYIKPFLKWLDENKMRYECEVGGR